MAVVNELVTKFTFEGSLKPLKDFQSGLKESIISIGKYTAAIGAATTATLVWANSTLRGAESLVRLRKDTNLTIQELQQLQFIAAQNGVSAEEFGDQILNLSEKIGEAATVGSDDFNRLGVSVRDANGNIKPTVSIIQDINNSFKNLSKEQQISFARKLGIDQKLITAFNKTDKELTNLIEKSQKFGVLTGKQAKQLDKYFASVETLKFGFTAVSRQVALNFAPVLESLSNNIVDFLAEFGSTFSKVFGEFFDGILNLIGGFNDLIKATVGWKTVLIAVGAALAIAFPVTIVVAAVTAILAIIEDLITAFKGGKSVIQDFFQDAFGVDIVSVLTNTFNFINGVIDAIIIKIKGFYSFASNIGNKVASFFGFGGDTPALQPLNNTTGASNNTNVNNNQIQINVDGSGDPQATANAVNQNLARELEQTNFQFGKGGR